MKNLKRLVVFSILILSTSLIVNCETKEQSSVAAGKSLEAVLSEMANLGESEKKIITFDIVYDKHSNSYAYENVNIIKYSKQAIDFAKGADPDFKYMDNSYEVECTDAEGNVTVTQCSDYACVGYAVALCVENGGCAKVCKAQAKYFPSIIAE